MTPAGKITIITIITFVTLIMLGIVIYEYLIPEPPPPIDPCQNISCPSGQTCVNGKCITAGPPLNPCINDVCPSGQKCVNGVCVNITPPPPIDPCQNVNCPSGQKCVNGVCVTPPPPIDPCQNVNCPSGQKCVNGVCVNITPPPPPVLINVIIQNVYDLNLNKPSYVSFRQTNNGASNSNPNAFSCNLINLSNILTTNDQNGINKDQNIWSIEYDTTINSNGGYLVNKLYMSNPGWGFGNSVPIVCSLGGFGVPSGCLLPCECKSFSNATQSCVSPIPPSPTVFPLYLLLNDDKTISIFIDGEDDGLGKFYLLFNQDSYSQNPLVSVQLSVDNTDKNKLIISSYS